MDTLCVFFEVETGFVDIGKLAVKNGGNICRGTLNTFLLKRVIALQNADRLTNQPSLAYYTG
jgi:hypothetical protein